MNRRALGRGRLLVVIGALVALAGMVPSWWKLPRTNEVALSGNGLEGAGIIIFLGVLALIAVVVLPYATRDGDSALDRPASYVLLALIAVGAYLFRIFEISRFNLVLKVFPTLREALTAVSPAALAAFEAA